MICIFFFVHFLLNRLRSAMVGFETICEMCAKKDAKYIKSVH